MSAEFDDGHRTGMALALALLKLDTSLPLEEGSAAIAPAWSLIDVTAQIRWKDQEDLQRQLQAFADRMSATQQGQATGMGLVVRELARCWSDADPSADPVAFVQEMILKVAEIDATPED